MQDMPSVALEPPAGARSPGREMALAVVRPRELSRSAPNGRTVTLGRGRGKRWEPPEGLEPADVLAIIDAAESERDRLLLRVLWATGARVSEALALRPLDVQRTALRLPNRKNPSRPTKVVHLPAGQLDLPGALLLWAREQLLADDEPLFFSCERRGGPRRALSRMQAWRIVKSASARARRPGPGAARLGHGPRRGAGACAPAPVPPRPRAPDRAVDQEPSPGPAAGRLGATPDRLPDAQRPRDGGDDGRRARVAASPTSHRGFTSNDATEEQ
jgi:Phage integrase family